LFKLLLVLLKRCSWNAHFNAFATREQRFSISTIQTFIAPYTRHTRHKHFTDISQHVILVVEVLIPHSLLFSALRCESRKGLHMSLATIDQDQSKKRKDMSTLLLQVHLL